MFCKCNGTNRNRGPVPEPTPEPERPAVPSNSKTRDIGRNRILSYKTVPGVFPVTIK